MFRILLIFLISVGAVQAQNSYVAERIDMTVAEPANLAVNPFCNIAVLRENRDHRNEKNQKKSKHQNS